MSISTDGQICYGILLEEDITFPWQDESYGGLIEDWYCYGVLGFKHPFELLDSHGDYIDGIKPSEERLTQYFQEKRDFLKKHPPLPVAMVNVCSWNNPVWIIAISESVIEANRGDPTVFRPMDLAENAPLKWNLTLTDFCKTHKIPFEGYPQWYLSSYWSYG